LIPLRVGVEVSMPTERTDVAPARTPQSANLRAPHTPDVSVVAAVCHDLRTPVASLHATVEVLTDHASLSADEIADQVERLRRGLTWLESLVDNLTAWAAGRDVAAELTCAVVPVRECIEQAILVVDPLLRQRRQTLQLSCPSPAPPLFANSVRVAQAVINLLMNASAYGPVGTPIAVDIRTEQSDVLIRVTDQGPGLNASEQQRVFDRYARGSVGSRNSKGLGLGLYIVRQIAELHGGSAGVDSLPGNGASFWIRLPLTGARNR
jgi:signal transduction histidine kinase